MNKGVSPCARAAMAAALVVALSSLSSAQCEPGWLNGPEHAAPGVIGHINAYEQWDPDGPGPLGDWLVVAGDFDIAGEVLTQNIAAWDGSAWHDMGGGVAGPVSSLAVVDGQLYAGGSFWFAGAADFTGDRLVDFADYLEFLNRYESRDPSADLNQNGQVDFSDYLEFLNHCDAGC